MSPTTVLPISRLATRMGHKRNLFLGANFSARADGHIRAFLLRNHTARDHVFPARDGKHFLSLEKDFLLAMILRQSGWCHKCAHVDIYSYYTIFFSPW